MKAALIVAGIVAALYVLHRLALWAESRGWIYYRHRHGSSSTLGNALLEIQSLLEPSSGAVVEERRRDVGEQDDAGDPPSDP